VTDFASPKVVSIWSHYLHKKEKRQLSDEREKKKNVPSRDLLAFKKKTVALFIIILFIIIIIFLKFNIFIYIYFLLFFNFFDTLKLMTN